MLLRKISGIITKRFIKHLEGVAKNDAETYEKFWAQFGRYMKEGVVTSWEHKDALGKLLRFESTFTEAGKLTSLDDYIGRMKENQKDIYVLYGASRAQLENSPYLEDAINNGGYFFRQYPLVVDGMAIEHTPKGTALRRALCEKEGTVFVVECDKITFHDFSQLLVNYGVTNAIYLVGSDSYGFYRTISGKRCDFGNSKHNEIPNITYMVWR